ncbi:MAG TPA: hypothetical protein VG714_01305 [Acidobacteriaceae bacterium]|nr:hypothetical protein [Acidobacteriaceae bacterium]
MKIISSARQRRPQPTKPFATLDDAEMALTMQELGEPLPPSRLNQTLMSPELLAEYASAASMIMDKQEREAMARQLLVALQNHPVAA